MAFCDLQYNKDWQSMLNVIFIFVAFLQCVLYGYALCKCKSSRCLQRLYLCLALLAWRVSLCLSFIQSLEWDQRPFPLMGLPWYPHIELSTLSPGLLINIPLMLHITFCYKIFVIDQPPLLDLSSLRTQNMFHLSLYSGP